MTDKYEEFKKWFIESDWVNCEVIIKKLPTNGGNAHLIYPNKKSIFENFEKEQAKKENEIEIKQTISYGMFDLNYYNLSIGNQKRVTTAYEILKRKELIK